MSDANYVGQRGVSASHSDFNNLVFLVQQALSLVRTGQLVMVKAVHGGGVGQAPTVDVQVLVKQMTGDGTTASHDIIYGRPHARNQGGLNAIINDPKVGDIGWLAVMDRDISSVLSSNGQESTPGSYRRHDLADGVFHSLPLTQTPPDQYTNYSKAGGGVDRVDNQGNSIKTGPSGIAHATTQSNAAHTIATSGSNANASTSTSGSNSAISHTTSGANSPITISAGGTGSALNLSSGTALNLSAPSISLPPGGVSGSALASGAAASNPGWNVLSIYANNAAARAGGVAVGNPYLNNTIQGTEQVLCIAF